MKILIACIGAALLLPPAFAQPVATGGGGTGNNTVCQDATGSTTTYTCPTPSPAITTLTGLSVTFVPQTTNGACPCTLNISGLGAKALKKSDGTTDIATSSLVGGSAYSFAYTGTVLAQTGGAGGVGGLFISATGGATNTLVAAPSPAITSYTNLAVGLKVDACTSGATTINISSVGAVNVFWNGAALSATSTLCPGAGTGNVYTLAYDGTRFNIITPVIPAGSAGQCYVSNGASAIPSFQGCPAGAAPYTTTSTFTGAPIQITAATHGHGINPLVRLGSPITGKQTFADIHCLNAGGGTVGCDDSTSNGTVVIVPFLLQPAILTPTYTISIR